MKKIFELFYRPENELTRETAGTGIGLALVQQLATAMGGRVDVRNCEPGAEFRVSLPAACSARRSAEVGASSSERRSLTSARDQQIRALYPAALERPTAERAAFVARS